MNQSRSNDRPLGLWPTIFSVLAAFFGVQSNRNRERDFSRGNPALFIAVGVVLLILLQVAIYVVVKIIVARAGL